MILALNTSTRQFSLALMERDGDLVAEHLETGRKGHFGSLMPTVRHLVAGCEKGIRDVTAVAVATGPGSFTGLRIGIAAAKGLVQALQVPIIGISSLMALASQLPYARVPITPVIESRRGELFAASFLWRSEHELLRQREDMSLRVDNLPQVFKEETVFVGNDFRLQGPLLKRLLGRNARLAPSPFWGIKASFLAHLGLARLRAGDVDDAYTLVPCYLRPPDIRPNPHPPHPSEDLLEKIDLSRNNCPPM